MAIGFDSHWSFVYMVSTCSYTVDILITMLILACHRDVINETSFLSEISVAPVLQVATVVPTADYTAHPAPTIKDIRIQSNGTPIIITNHSQAFAYHLKMKVWTRICDAWQMLSELWGSGSQNMDAEKHPLGWLSRATTTIGHKASSIGHHAKTLARMDHQATSIITLGHIEVKVIHLSVNPIISCY
jgi:protein HIRA/HIR1